MNTWQYNSTWSPPEREIIQNVGLTERDTECGTHRERYRVWDSQREITECGTHRERYRVWDSQREIQSVGLAERDTECGTRRERYRVWDSQREIQSVGLTERDTECGTHRERYRVWDSQREIQSVGLAERDTECGTRRERYRVWDSQREIQSVGLTEIDTECGTHRWLQLFEAHEGDCSSNSVSILSSPGEVERAGEREGSTHNAAPLFNAGTVRKSANTQCTYTHKPHTYSGVAQTS